MGVSKLVVPLNLLGFDYRETAALIAGESVKRI